MRDRSASRNGHRLSSMERNQTHELVTQAAELNTLIHALRFGTAERANILLVKLRQGVPSADLVSMIGADDVQGTSSGGL